MSKIRITVVTIGHMPPEFNKGKIENWHSDIFEITGKIENYSLDSNSDGEYWEYSDVVMSRQIPRTFDGDFLIAIANVPLELNWYARRLSENRAVITFHEMKDILVDFNIPIENLVHRCLYAYSLVFKRNSNRMPTHSELTGFTHDETKGCLFDMTGIKTEIIYSCHKPKICAQCVEQIKSDRVSSETIDMVANEIQAIQKNLFYRITDFIKKKPVWTLVISAVSAIVLGAIGSVIASFVYEILK
jgi:hypothetical protein